MRYQEIKEQVVDEAPMNPTAFAKSIKSGQEKGVQVGFEFEVCIPKTSVQKWKNGDEANPGEYTPDSTAWIDGKTPKDMIEGIVRYGRMNVNDALNDLIKNKASVDREIGYTKVWDTYVAWVEKQMNTFKETHKSDMIPKLKQLMKSPLMKEPYSELGHRANEEDTRTVKDVTLEVLKQETGLDFSGKISAAALRGKKREIISAMNKMYYATSRPIDRMFMEVAEADDNAISSHRAEYFPGGRFMDTSDPEVAEAVNKVAENFNRFCKDVYGTDNLKDLLKTKWAFRGRVNNTTDTLKQKLWYFVTPGAEVPQSLSNAYRSGSTNYKDGAEFLKDNLKGSFGENMVIFNNYHQQAKELDKWYIEPDGSLHPKDGDYSAEVVTPPLMAQQAMTDLKTFYTKAHEMSLYTNNSTGLHINVSIPDALDVLKLAMFVGDQHILKSFGRENNRYADSVLKNLQNRANRGVSTSWKDAEAELKATAERLSGDHFATVNFNGNYVSFRHAGGDYLNQYEQIKNTVGRFIHAMIIASNPAMYREEYLKKLTAMVGKAAFPEEKFDIRARGIPAIIMDFVLFKDEQGGIENAKNSVAAWVLNNINPDHYITSSEGSAEQLLKVNGLSASTRERITSAGDSGCVRAVVYPTDTHQVNEINLLSRQHNLAGGHPSAPFGVYEGGTRYNSGRTKVAVGTMRLTKLTQKDKGFAQAYRGLAGGPAKRLPLPEGDE